MKTIYAICMAGIAAVTCVLAFSGNNFSEKFEAMPKAAQETAMANMEGALPVGIATVQGERGWEYQINTRRNGESHSLVIDEAGKLLAVKDETTLAQVPAAVQAAIAKEGAESKIVTLEKVTEGAQVSYGAVIQEDGPGKFVRVSVAADGTVKQKKHQDTDR